MHPPSSLRLSSGFTLIETFTVVGILTLLIALATPSMLNAIRSSRMTAAGEIITGKLVEAQGLALTFSSDVELRFYKAAGTELDDSNAGQYLQLLQLVENKVDPAEVDEDTPLAVLRPMGSSEPLPDGVSISDNPEFSSLWKLQMQEEETPKGNREYVAIRFRPDGSTDLAETEDWHLTLVEYPTQDSSKLPPNFYTVQIDPITAKIETYRPE